MGFKVSGLEPPDMGVETFHNSDDDTPLLALLALVNLMAWELACYFEAIPAVALSKRHLNLDFDQLDRPCRSLLIVALAD